MKATQLLHNLGQSLWLDNITRDLINSGTLKRYIDELSVTGLTSNPTIFDHAIENSSSYDAAIRKKLDEGKSGERLFFELALEDLTRAADLFRPIFDRTNGVDGWVVDSQPTFRADPENYPEELWGIEDPRITFVEELGRYAVAYTAFMESRNDETRRRIIEVPEEIAAGADEIAELAVAVRERVSAAVAGDALSMQHPQRVGRPLSKDCTSGIVFIFICLPADDKNLMMPSPSALVVRLAPSTRSSSRNFGYHRSSCRSQR